MHSISTQQRTGWLSASKLSVRMATSAGWTDALVDIPSAYGVQGEQKMIYANWVSLISVGLLAKDEGFTDPKMAASRIMDCLSRSSYYVAYTGRKDISNQAVTINGHPGRYLRTNVLVSLTGQPTIKGDVVDVVVVDLGDNTFGVFMSTCTMGDTTVCAQVNTARKSLTVAK